MNLNTKSTNPYVGPRSFETGDALYGRDREVGQLASLLIAERIVLLHSPSGAGKTSLIQAGLLPRLADDFNILPIVRVGMEIRNTGSAANRYVLSTLFSLEEGLPEEQRRPLEELSALTLDQYLETRPRPEDAPQTQLLIFDQFEEILTAAPTDRQGKQEFFAQLGAALRNRKRWALFAVREDFLGQFAPYILPIPNRFNVKFRLDLLAVDAAREAIQSPARNAGVNFTQSAAQKLVDDLRSVLVQLPDGSIETQLGQYVEPVQLQVVCYNLWQPQVVEDGIIDESDLTRMGDVNHALADFYAGVVHDVCAATGVDERNIREWFGKRLITKEGFRGHVLMGQESSEGLSNVAVRLLENAHIVRGDKRAGATWFELAHDRMIEPINKNNADWFNENLSLFQKQAALWMERNRAESLLLRGKSLTEAEKEASRINLTQAEQDYLKACRDLRAHLRRQRIVVTGFTLVILFSLSGALLTFWQISVTAQKNANIQANLAAEAQANAQLAEQNEKVAKEKADEAAKNAQIAEENAKLAREQAQKTLAAGLAAQAISQKNIDYPLALLLASESYKREPDSMLARNALFDVLEHTPYSRLFGHRAQVTGVAFSPQAGLLASAGCQDDSGAACKLGEIILWDAKTHQLLSRLPGDYGFVRGVSFSPDGKTLASAGCIPIEPGSPQQGCAASYGQVVLWDVSDPGAPRRLAENRAEHTSFPYTLAFSQDGKTLASAGTDQKIVLWNIGPQTMEKAGEILQAHSSFIFSLAFHPNNGLLASGGDDFFVHLWNVSDVADPQPGATIDQQKAAITGVAFSPDGARLAASSKNKTVIVWEMAGDVAQNPQILNGHKASVNSVAFSPNAAQLASAGANGEILLWDVQSLAQRGLSLRVHTGAVYALAFGAPQAGQLALVSASADRSVILWDVLHRQPVAHPQAPVQVNPGGDVSATSGSLTAIAHGQVITLEGPQGSLSLDCGHTGQVNSLAFSPVPVNGKLLLASASDDQTIILWDVNQSSCESASFFKMTGFDKPLLQVSFSLDGKLLTSVDAAGSTVSWQVDPAEWQLQACQATAGRSLTQDEVTKYLQEPDYQGSCQ